MWVVGKGKNMKAIPISEIKLESGSDNVRTIMSETGLPATTMVQYVGRQTRWTGTGYSNSLYRIVGTDDLLVIYHNSGSINNIYRDSVAVTKEYFAEQKSYAKRVGILSRKYQIPFEVGLAIGDKEDLYSQLKNAMVNVDVSVGTIRDFNAGINRRKAGIMAILGSELYNALNIDSMGQRNSERIAQYLAKHCEDRLS